MVKALDKTVKFARAVNTDFVARHACTCSLFIF